MVWSGRAGVGTRFRLTGTVKTGLPSAVTDAKGLHDDAASVWVEGWVRGV